MSQPVRNADELPAVGTPVERPVGPCGWRWLDSLVFRRKVPSYSTPSEWGPVYDQNAIDTAVALAEARYIDLMLAVEWMLADGGNMTQEHLARIRAAWERA